MISIKIILN